MRKITATISLNWSMPVAIVSLVITAVNVYFPLRNLGIYFVILSFVITIIIVFSKIYIYQYVEVPNIKGYTVEKAREKLDENHLKFPEDLIIKSEDEDEDEDDVIVLQNPKNNSFVRKNSIVTIITHKQFVEENISKFGKDFEFRVLAEAKLNAMGDTLTGFFKGIKYSDGSIYTGHYIDGVPNGGGAYQGDIFVYAGDFVNGLPEGIGRFGIIKSDDDRTAGSSYKGAFSEGRFNGHGIAIIDGDRYEGEWVNDQMCGKGTYIYGNGNKYEGDWINGVKDGYGIFTWGKTGNKYEGNWTNDNKNGKGTYTWDNDGTKFEGNFVEDKRHGIGKLTYGEGNEFAGDVIEGYYVDDLRNGEGTYYHKDGSHDKGTWKDGKKQGTFLCYNADGQFMREEKYADGEKITKEDAPDEP